MSRVNNLPGIELYSRSVRIFLLDICHLKHLYLKGIGIVCFVVNIRRSVG